MFWWIFHISEYPSCVDTSFFKKKVLPVLFCENISKIICYHQKMLKKIRGVDVLNSLKSCNSKQIDELEGYDLALIIIIFCYVSFILLFYFFYFEYKRKVLTKFNRIGVELRSNELYRRHWNIMMFERYIRRSSWSYIISIPKRIILTWGVFKLSSFKRIFSTN